MIEMAVYAQQSLGGFIAAAYFTQIGSKKSLEESSKHEFTLVESSKAPY